MRRLLILSSLLLWVSSAVFAQDVSIRYQGQVIGSRGTPLANQNVAVCSQPANTTTQPCSPLITLGTSTSTTTGGANPLTTDVNGNFFFYAASGKYTIQIYGPQISTPFLQPDTNMQCAPSANCTYTGTQTFTVGLIAPVGSQGTPSYGFSGQSGQGMYYNTTVLATTFVDGGSDALGILPGALMFNQNGGVGFFHTTAGAWDGVGRDTGFSRPAAGVICADTVTINNCLGSFKSASVIASGPAAVLTGTGACATITTQTGGSWAGSAKCTAATAASTLTITPGTTAPNGWACDVWDETTRANLFQQTSHTTAACVLTITSVTQNDVFVFKAVAF